MFIDFFDSISLNSQVFPCWPILSDSSESVQWHQDKVQGICTLPLQLRDSVWRHNSEDQWSPDPCLNISGVSGGCKQRISCYNNRCRLGRGGMPRGCFPGWGKWSVLTVSMMDLLCCGMPVNCRHRFHCFRKSLKSIIVNSVATPPFSLSLSNIFLHLKFIRSRKEEIAIAIILRGFKNCIEYNHQLNSGKSNAFLSIINIFHRYLETRKYHLVFCFRI